MGAVLEKLRDLTNKLPSFPPMISGDADNCYREYKMDKGDCFAWFIHRSGNDIAVHRWFSSEGTVFPEHLHKEKEWVIVYKGAMNLKYKDETVVLKAGDYHYNEPNTPHSAYFPEDCRYITVTIPPGKEYPDGK